MVLMNCFCASEDRIVDQEKKKKKLAVIADCSASVAKRCDALKFYRNKKNIVGVMT